MGTTMHLSLRTLFLATMTLAAAAAVAVPVHAEAPSPALQQLVDTAEYWNEHGRPDKAADAWRKLLLSDPTHARALQELAIYEARAGRKKLAEGYLDRLEKAHPGHPAILESRRLIQLGSKYESLLDEARDEWKAGEKHEAIATYRRAFGKQGPTGKLAVEFYTRLASVDDAGWQEAREGFERLLKTDPGSAELKLRLAEHLSYREPTRRDAIARLAALADHPDVGPRAREAWRRALTWLGATKRDAPLYEQALKTLGPDEALSDKLAEITRPEPTRPGRTSQSRTLAKAYRALDTGRIDEAERLFQKRLAQRKRSVVARHGLAMVAMARQDFERAQVLIEEIRKRAPTRRELWKEPQAEVESWLRLRKAEELRKEGRLGEAEELLTREAERYPAHARHARLILGRIYVSQGKPKKARMEFQAVLDADPDNMAALGALAELALATGEFDEARRLNERLAALDTSKAMEPEKLEAERLRGQAALARAEARPEEALDLLEEARRIAPESRWVLHDLVHTHLALRDVAAARAALDELLALGDDVVAHQLARALVLLEEGRMQASLSVLEGLPDDPTDVDMRKLRRRIDVRIAAGRIAREARTRTSGTWRQELEALEADVSEEPELQILVALAWSEAGEHGRALALADRAAARIRDGSASVDLVRGAILLRAGHDHELSQLLDRLAVEGKLTGRERADHDALRIALAVRRADAAREDGEPDRAFDYLRPFLQTHPERPEILSALARLFVAKEEYGDALAIYQRLLRRNPDDFAARDGAVGASMALDRRKDARRLVEEGLQRTPDEPAMLLVAARQHSLAGRDDEAVELLGRARTIIESRQAGVLEDVPSDGQPPLEEDSEYTDIVLLAFQRFEPWEWRGEPRATDVSLPRRIRDEEARIEARYAKDVSAMPGLRYRDGESGLGQVLEFTTPLSASIATGYHGRLRLTVTPTIVTAGSLDVGPSGEGERFGALGVHDVAPGSQPIDQVHSGAALALSWDWDYLSLHGGTTPLGFPLMTFVGGARFGFATGVFGMGIEVERRAVTDSVLALAGTYEPVTGEPWGLVTANGGQIDLHVSSGDFLAYLYGGYDFLTGTDVLDNQRGHGGLGARWRIHDDDGGEVWTGLALGFMGYEQNQDHFTLGHGGYFSPQIFVNMAIPLHARGARGPLRYNLKTDLGFNWFEEDSAPYFPLRSDLQARRAARVDADGEAAESIYEGKTSLGLAWNLDAWLGYEVADQLVAGVQARAHTAVDYVEAYAGFFIGYSFGEHSVPTFPGGLYEAP